jgi:hypothetical protein
LVTGLTNTAHPTAPATPTPQPGSKQIPTTEWRQRLDSVKITKEEMDRLVMDYLVTEASNVNHTGGGEGGTGRLVS